MLFTQGWLLVPVNAKLVRKFLSMAVKIDPAIDGVIERVNDERWYVINEEEY